jgi:dCTP deaminase
MFAVQPVRIYGGLRICQIFFHELTGNIREYDSEKYQNNHDIQPSMFYKEFGHGREYEQMELDFGSLAASCTTQPSRNVSTEFEQVIA